MGWINYLRRSPSVIIPFLRIVSPIRRSGRSLVVRIISVATTRTVTITIAVTVMFPFSNDNIFWMMVVVTTIRTRTVRLGNRIMSRRSNRGSSHAIRIDLLGLRNRNRLWNRLPLYGRSPFPMFSMYGMRGSFSRISIGLNRSLCMRMHLGSRRRRANRRRSSLGESVHYVPRGTQKT